MKSYLALGMAIVLAVATSAHATVFFTDDFNYSDGDLTAVSGGFWFAHSAPGEGPIQVVNEKAVLEQPGLEDVNRWTGGPSLAPGDTWYYAVRFSVEDMRATPGVGAIANTYFAHFSDGGTQNFRGRLNITSGSDPANFSMGVSSSSTGSGHSMVPWTGDLSFDTTYVAVVSYTASQNVPELGDTLQPGDGWSSLWVNPVDSSSPSITDTNPNPNVGSDVFSGMNALALRQQGGGARRADILVDTVAMGDNFDEVLAAVGGSPPVADGDFDGDGVVDGKDFLLWQRGGSPNPGSPGDLAAWESNFGSGAPFSTVVAIPEPSSMALVAFCFGAIALRRRNGK